MSNALDFPNLCGYNTVHTFNQAPVDYHVDSATFNGLTTVNTLSQNPTPQLLLSIIQCIYVVWPPVESPRLPYSWYNTVHTFSKTPTDYQVDSPTLNGLNTVHTFSKTPVKHH